MNENNILIFGDSYSTFAGYIPEGYAAYYPRLDVSEADQTWWKIVANRTQGNIIQNNSWSGSTVCNTGYSGDCSKTSSFIHRLSVMIEDGFFLRSRIDRVLVFGGTNDSWTDNAAGQNLFDGWSDDDLRLVLPGFCYFVHTLLTVVPRDKVHIIINTGLRAEVETGIREICGHYGIGYTLLQDIDKEEGHPTRKGMAQIADQVLSDLL